MAATLGSGAYLYEPQDNWAKLPEGWRLGEVAAVAVDDRDRVYVFNRSERPMVVFDREGNFLSTWGQDLFKRPHGLHIGPDQAIYCTDDGAHTVCKCSLDGRLLLRIGQPDHPAPRMSGKPFCRCTHTALSPQGEIYVSDGYGNANIHKYSPDGRHLFSWGGPGTDEGQFNLPHNIICDGDGWVYVADRENHRIQVFDGQGRYEQQWNNLHRPSALFMSAGPCPVCYVGELASYMAVNRETPNLGPRISILSDGKLVGRLTTQDGPGIGAAQFTSPHGVAVDSHGDLYVGEVTASSWPSLFPGQKLPENLNAIKKFRRITSTEQ